MTPKNHRPFLLSLVCGLFPLLSLSAQQRLVWADEFDRDGVPDPAKWGYQQGFTRNHEAQWYRPENAYCRDGLLVIEATADTVANPLFTRADEPDWRRNRPQITCHSASLNTRESLNFLYGRLEVRARIPAGAGAWPAIWTLGRGLPWPSCGEIDIMECYPVGGESQILANAAVGTDTPHNARWNSSKTPLSHFTDRDPHWLDRFHTWAMDWTPEEILITLDGEELNRIPLSETFNGSEGGGSNPFNSPQYLLLNLAIGGDNGGTPDASRFPLRYEIDYVRLYQD